MKAIVLEQPGTFRLTTMDEPGTPGPGEALVRVRQVGVCGTDLHAYQGTQPFFTYPRILGHELCVEVVTTGASELGDHEQGDHIQGDHIQGDHEQGDHIQGDHEQGDHIQGDHIQGDHEGRPYNDTAEAGSSIVGAHPRGRPARGRPVLAPGTLCAVEPYFHCGRCPACLRGKPNCCLNLQVFGVHIDGGMREFAHIPTRYLHPSQTLSYEQLALVEPLAIGSHAVSRAQLNEGEQVLVVGAGPIGLAVTQFALLARARVSVMDVSEQRLASCRQYWPQVTCIDGRDNPSTTLQNLFGDDLPTVVFDATGNVQSMQAAFSYVGHGGRLIFVGLFQGDITFHDPEFHRRELTLFSSRNATATDFRQIITFLEKDQINLAPWVTYHANADAVPDTFPRWFNYESGIIKAMIEFL